MLHSVRQNVVKKLPNPSVIDYGKNEIYEESGMKLEEFDMDVWDRFQEF